MCGRNSEHLDSPIVCAPVVKDISSNELKHRSIYYIEHLPFIVPERATKSFSESPWLAKFSLSLSRLRNGPGIDLLASALLAVMESLLPNPTSQEGPPSCKFQQSFIHE